MIQRRCLVCIFVCVWCALVVKMLFSLAWGIQVHTFTDATSFWTVSSDSATNNVPFKKNCCFCRCYFLHYSYDSNLKIESTYVTIRNHRNHMTKINGRRLLPGALTAPTQRALKPWDFGLITNVKIVNWGMEELFLKKEKRTNRIDELSGCQSLCKIRILAHHKSVMLQFAHEAVRLHQQMKGQKCGSIHWIWLR